jgi:hypothetical protein
LLERRLRKIPGQIILNFDGARHDCGIRYPDERLTRSDAASVGNPVLVDLVRKHCPPIEWIESAVDCDRHKAKNDFSLASPLRLCRSGAPSSYRYHHLHREPHRRFGRIMPYQITIMSRSRFSLSDPEIHDRWLPFSHTGEAAIFHGLLPLRDERYERAKENHKTEICLDSGLPVVASPVGMNNSFLSHGERGMLARTHDDWGDAISALAKSATLRDQSACVGREFIARKYGIPVIGNSLLAFFRSRLESRVTSPPLNAVAI